MILLRIIEIFYSGFFPKPDGLFISVIKTKIIMRRDIFIFLFLFKITLVWASYIGDREARTALS